MNDVSRCRRAYGRPGRAGFVCVCGAVVLTCAVPVLPAAGQDPAEGMVAAGAPSVAPEEDGLEATLARIRAALATVAERAGAGAVEEASRLALRTYLDEYERVELLYGAGGPNAAAGLSARVTAAEARFHELLSARDASLIERLATTLGREMASLEAAARAADVPVSTPVPVAGAIVDAAPLAGVVRTPEVRSILSLLEAARGDYAAGRPSEALAAVERAYLEGFEPIEARVRAPDVRRVESLIHLRLRPQIARGAAIAEVNRTIGALRGELLAVDGQLGASASIWFGALNSFIIIVREGLEAVLLVGAILGYLKATDAPRHHERRIYAGVAAGVAASFATWFLARTIIPVTGASREMLEGITALLAVGVLLYVSNWLFQKTYIHDWKQYLKENVGRAVSAGSGLAMAALAFAAVYREGFETVLFYQAIVFDAGVAAVAAGFIPGLLLILLVGIGIIRLGVRLPLRRMFALTNAILLYLAFVFIGKGLYNLQEAGVFAPRPIHWLPDSEVLRQVAGFYPVLETLLAQLCFLLLLAATYVLYRRRLTLANA